MNQNADNRPVHLFFKRFKATPYLSNTAAHTVMETLDHRVIPCDSWDDLPEKLKLKPKSICFFHTELDKISAIDVVNMVNTLSRLVGIDYKISISVGIGKDTKYKLIKELQKSDLQGLIPAYVDFGMHETIKGLQAQWSGITYWPKYIIDQLLGSPRMG